MLKNLATDRFRWIALAFLAFGLAIVIIDNTVLNVAIPYILRDLNTSLDNLEWVISGYALIIATLLITAGRMGDIFGRKKVFLLGTVCFAIGSFIASVAPNIGILFFGEAFIEAIGAAMMLTSSLSLLATEFQGHERAIAFGIWGAVAGASGAVGPLLGGWLTTYYSWRWSLRINVLVAVITVLGSVFIKESKGEGGKTFDWWGTVLSGLGLFFLIFALIEGRKFGWYAPNETLTFFGCSWPFESISVIPFSFLLALLFLLLFGLVEHSIEKKGDHPLLKLTMFQNLGFSLGLLTVGISSLGQLGLFFVLPIYLQNVLGFDAFKSGLTFIPASVSIFFAGALSGFLASRIGPKWIVSVGMVILAAGVLYLGSSVKVDATALSLMPALIVFGLGMGMATAQLTNLVLSSIPVSLAGEAAGANATMRQVGSSIGVAIIGAALTSSLAMGIETNVKNDKNISPQIQEKIIEGAKISSTQIGGKAPATGLPKEIQDSIKGDINQSLVAASQDAIKIAYFFVLIGAAASVLIPAQKVVRMNRSSEEA
jgi:EmrB/QacA subfamily drug resistance transporter